LVVLASALIAESIIKQRQPTVARSGSFLRFFERGHPDAVFTHAVLMQWKGHG
jgi:hypothetical protein